MQAGLKEPTGDDGELGNLWESIPRAQEARGGNHWILVCTAAWKRECAMGTLTRGERSLLGWWPQRKGKEGILIPMSLFSPPLIFGWWLPVEEPNWKPERQDRLQRWAQLSATEILSALYQNLPHFSGWHIPTADVVRF